MTGVPNAIYVKNISIFLICIFIDLTESEKIIIYEHLCESIDLFQVDIGDFYNNLFFAR